jgi:hypothetical protein
MLSLHILRAPYMVPTQSWVDWSLPGHYLFTTWSVHGPFLVLSGLYAVPTLYVHNTVPTWSLYSLPGPSMVPTRSWSLPGRFLINIWLIPGPFVISM